MEEKVTLKNAQIWAVLGVTEDKEKYGYKIYKKLKEIKKEVYGISPKYNEIEGDIIYNSIEALPKLPEVVVFVVNPRIGMGYVKECTRLGIKTIWLQPGTVSEELLSTASENNINPIEACILVVSNYL